MSPHKRPLFLVHGLAGLLNSWDHNVSYLSRYFDVNVIELPDYALSKEGYGLPHLVTHVLDEIRATGCTDIALAGNSMGGQIASVIAAYHPRLVSHLILVASSGLFDELGSSGGMPIPPMPSRRALARAAKRVFHDKTLCTEELLDNVVATYSTRANRIRFSGMLKTSLLIKTYNLSKLLKRIQIPSLVVWGFEDEIIPVRVAFDFHRSLSLANLAVFAACGHAPQIEKPDLFNRAVRDFIHTGGM